MSFLRIESLETVHIYASFFSASSAKWVMKVLLPMPGTLIGIMTNRFLL